MSLECPTEDTLRHLVMEGLASDELRRIEEHLEVCEACRANLERVTGGDLRPPPRLDLEALEKPSAHLDAVIRRLGDADITSGPATVCPDELSFLDPTNEAGEVGRFGRYRILQPLGQGAMGVVLLARDPDLERSVAVKVLRPKLAMHEEARQRFLREARSAAAVQNDHVVTIHTVDVENGLPYLVMEYIVGESLQERLADGALPRDEVLRLGLEVARGLAAAHAQGLVHRDVKPANILIEADSGRAKITDFGLAKPVGDIRLTRPGVIAGTPEYMSPEQTRGKKIDARSDLFSLGLVLYAACTGQSPLQGDTIDETMEQVTEATPKPLDEVEPSLPRWFCRLVSQLLEKSPERRMQSAAEVAEVFESENTSSRKTHPIWLVALAACFGAAAITAVVMLAVRFGGPQDITETAEHADRTLSGFSVSGVDGSWATFGDAVSAAGTGDTITVNENGPFLWTPLEITGKPLTVRAGEGVRPVFLPDVSISRDIDYFIKTDADLTLDGLEIHSSVEGPPVAPSPEVILSRCAISVRRARVTLLDCTIVATRHGACLGSDGSHANLQDCRFRSELGPCVYWRPRTEAELAIDDCNFMGPVAVTLDSDVDSDASSDTSVVISGNQIATSTVFHVFMAPGERRATQITARNNVIDAGRLLQFVSLRPAPRRAMNLDRQRLLRLVRNRFNWSEEANVYEPGVQWLSCRAFRRPAQVTDFGPERLADWLELWGLPSDASRYRDPTSEAKD